VAPAVYAAAASGFWPDLVHALHGKVPAGEYSFLSNAKMVQGAVDGPLLTLWAQNDFVRSMVNKPAILTAVEAEAKRLLGGAYRVVVSVGTPPAASAVPAPVPAAQPADQGHDKLDDLLENFGDIITEE